MRGPLLLISEPFFFDFGGSILFPGLTPDTLEKAPLERIRR